MSYGVGWFGRVFGTLGMFGSVVFLVRDGPPTRNHPGRAAVFGPPPRQQRLGDRNGKRSTSRKKNAYFVFNLLIINNINQYFNTHLHLISFIIYNR
mgnify:CR=1 FL=1